MSDERPEDGKRPEGERPADIGRNDRRNGGSNSSGNGNGGDEHGYGDRFKGVDLSAIFELQRLNDQQRERMENSQIAFAAMFAQRHRGAFVFDHDIGGWFHWGGQHWQRERTQLAFHLMGELVADITESMCVQVREKMRQAAVVAGAERLAKAHRELAGRESDWNRDPFLLATLGGTVDLRTGELRSADPEDRINRVTAVAPAARAECPRWLRFLEEATGKDKELVGFLQRWSGYCLTGSTREHALVFCYGPGGTGKTVFLNTVAGIFGDYATNAAMETFTASKYESHPTDLAMLAGARLVTASETEEGRAWAENRIKRLTGGDPITARFMRQDFFTYVPGFKLTIVGNHEPSLRNVDAAMKRRFNIVPFKNTPQKVDQELPEALKAEWPGVLRWMIEGCLEWQKKGLQPPKSVREATADYFDTQDLLAQWLEDSCDADREGKYTWTATSAALFASWTRYAKAAGDEPGSRRAFARKLEMHGFKAFREEGTERTRMWSGLRLKPAAPRQWYGQDDN